MSESNNNKEKLCQAAMQAMGRIFPNELLADNPPKIFEVKDGRVIMYSDTNLTYLFPPLNVV